MVDTNIDFYAEANSDSDGSLYNGYNTIRGQAFAYGGAGETLDKAKFYLKKTGSPTGNATAVLYACTGTPGTTGDMTGAVLATSGTFDVSTLTTSYQLIEFTFASPYTLAASTNYCLGVEYTGGTSTNHVEAGYDGSSPSHAGNYFSSAGPVSGRDAIFYAIHTVTGWVAGKFMGVANASISKIDGVLKTSIAKVNGI